MFYCFLADGFEEIEALATVDILKRADIKVNTVSVENEYIKGGHNITVKADMTINDIKTFDDIDGIILPGGMPGVTNLDKSEKLKDIINFCIDNNRLVCAICAAPSLLGRMGVLKNIKATCYPGFEDELLGAEVLSSKVVCDKNFITAKGPGCSFDFAYAIVTIVKSESVAKDVFGAMQI